MADSFTASERIAYFSMEVALRADIPTYAGGLGVLAGDTLRAAADCELPMVAVTLASRRGYFRQELGEDGWQREHEQPWDPAQFARAVEAHVSVPIEGRDVWVGGWLHIVTGITGGRVPVILLDTDLDANQAGDRALTHYLYGGDEAYRLKQEIVLGIGGARMLDALGYRVRQYHMNEGHSALLVLHLLRRFAYPDQDLRAGDAPYDVPGVRSRCNFTTHTPVEAGHDRFGYDLVQRVLGEFVDVATLKSLAGQDNLNMTRLALNAVEYVNGVAKRHAQTSERMFPGYRVRAVTNGVHAGTWASAPMRRLFDAFLPADPCMETAGCTRARASRRSNGGTAPEPGGADAAVAASGGILLPLLSYWTSLQSVHARGAALGTQSSFASLGQALGSSSAGGLFALTPGAPFWAGALAVAISWLAVSALASPRSVQHVE